METLQTKQEQHINSLWFRAAVRECIEYGDHGTFIEQRPDGSVVCFDCGSEV